MSARAGWTLALVILQLGLAAGCVRTDVHMTSRRIVWTETPSATRASTPAPMPLAPQPGVFGPLSGRTVAIDPGHNGANGAHANEINRLVDAVTLHKPCDTTGTATDSGYAESAFNYDVAERLARILRAEGARVVLTRTTDAGWGPCITERAAIGNRNHADVALSIHADGGPPSGRGFHVIEPALIPGHTETIVEPSRRLGTAIRDAYRNGTGVPTSTYLGRDGIDIRNDLGGLNLSTVPKVFIECANMRNALDAALLSSTDFRQRIARALAAGIGAYLAGR